MNSRNKLRHAFDIKRHQIRTFAVIAIILVVIICLVLFFSNSNENKNGSNTATAKKSVTTPLASATTHIDDSSIWLQRAENMLLQERKETENLKQKIADLDKEKTAQFDSVKSQEEKIAELQQKLNRLETELATQKQSGQYPGNISHDGSVLPVLPASNSAGSPTAFNFEIKSDDLSLVLADNTIIKNDKTPDTYVPAGSFARAILLSGLDASAGVTSQTQPRPVTLRIIDQGTLPNHHHSHLKNCLVTGAGFGDISSERAYIRLERMSCVGKSGQTTDFPVFGYVSGSDGKAGIRGIPVWREGALLQRSFVSGLLSGISQGVANSYTNTTVSPIGGATQTVDSDRILKFGMANGASTAMGKLADYNIRRAEQYQPIIQVSAGIQVDIVFHTGFYLDGRKPDENNSTTQTPSSSSTPTTGDTSS